MQETAIPHVAGILNGWFFIEGSVTAWMKKHLKGKHESVLRGIAVDDRMEGTCIAWAPSMDQFGEPIYVTPIGFNIHCPFWYSKKPVAGLFITSTIKYLAASIASDGILRTKDDTDEEEGFVTPKPNKRARGSSDEHDDDRGTDNDGNQDSEGWQWPGFPGEDTSIFDSRGKYVGLYRDELEGPAHHKVCNFQKMPIIRMDNQSISYSSYDVFMDLGGNISLTSFI